MCRIPRKICPFVWSDGGSEHRPALAGGHITGAAVALDGPADSVVQLDDVTEQVAGIHQRVLQNADQQAGEGAGGHAADSEAEIGTGPILDIVTISSGSLNSQAARARS
jgi:hypothetical protein